MRNYLLCLVVILAIFVMGPRCAEAVNDTCSWKPGIKDINGVRMNGTEIIKITAHKGKLFAATSMWMESDKSLGGCQVLVKDDEKSAWKVEHQFRADNSRLTALEAFEFRTDYSGKKIDPVKLLLAAPTVSRNGMFEIWSRRDKVGRWVAMPLGRVKGTSQVRGMGFYKDSVTGAEMVFAGVSGNKSSVASLGLITGSYKTDAAGRILWNKRPELVLPQGERFMGFTVCNGVFYASTSNNIFKRTDGPNPKWKSVYYDKKLTAPGGIRGFATVPGIGKKPEALIFISWGVIRRLDPGNGHKETVELDIAGFLTDQWDLPIDGSLAGYNKIVHYDQPPGPGFWLIGFQSSYDRKYIERGKPKGHHIKIRDDGKRPIRYFAAEGRYLIRSLKNGKPLYQVRTIEHPGKNQIGAVRTICKSPFAGDKDVLYMGGVDCNGMPSHDTGWVYRVELGNINKL